MKTLNIAAGVAVSLCVTLSASSGQAPTTQPPIPAQPTQRVMPSPRPAMSLTGCLYRERDIPGRTPDVTEKTGVVEGYIVADARIVGQGSSAPGPVAGTGGRTYRVEDIPNEQLRALVGKRVEVAGRIETDDEDGSRPDRNSIPRDLVDFADFVASSIREVAGGTACSPKPPAAPTVPR